MEVPAETNILEVNIARTVIFDENDRLLVLWRADNDSYNAGGPDLPGGGLEPPETPSEAAIRETYEETGIDLAQTALRQVCEIITEENDGTRIKRLTRTFFAACVKSPIIALRPEEHHSHEFVPLARAREIFVDSTTKLQCLEEVVALQTRGELAAA